MFYGLIGHIKIWDKSIITCIIMFLMTSPPIAQCINIKIPQKDNSHNMPLRMVQYLQLTEEIMFTGLQWLVLFIGITALPFWHLHVNQNVGLKSLNMIFVVNYLQI